jgi:5'-nucleotidase / UDP-sugar diphosphatase
MLKRLLSLILMAVLVLSQFTVATAEGSNDNSVKTTKIVLLHTNDSHSRVFEGKYAGMGFAKLSTLVKQYEELNANTLLLDAGDTFHGQTFATLTKGKSIADVLNAVGYDGMAAGNHDFNYGYERLLELTQVVNFPVLSANVIYEDSGELVLPPYMIKEVDGIKLGFFGLSTPETHYKTHPNNIKGLKFTDPVIASQKMVAELTAQGVDAIIAVSHLGTDASSTDTSIKVAEGAEGIDLIVDGHSHTTDNVGVSGTLIVSAGEYLKNLGVVELEFHGKNLVNKTASLITKEDAADIQPDADVEAVIKAIEDEQKEILSEVVGETSNVLDGERDTVRKAESNLGNLIADAMVEVTSADFALTNGGGIRASIDAGEITKEEVITVLPFGNYIQTKAISGKDIKAALENGASGYPANHGAFAHVSGLTYAIDASKDAGERVHSIMINGKSIEMDKTYSMATNDFLAAGGDNYTMFKDLKHTGDYAALDEALITYIKARGTVAPKTEGRILFKKLKEEKDKDKEKVFEYKSYVIKLGDTLSAIAVKYDTTWHMLEKINNIENPDLIFAGETIKVPTTKGVNNTYIVKAGDNLSFIASHYGLTWQQLNELNNLENPDLIFPGQKINVPTN